MDRRAIAFLFMILFAPFTYAVKEINLGYESVFLLKSLKPGKAFAIQPITIKETRHEKDILGMSHIRVQEMYQGIEVIGGDAIVHSQKNATSLAMASDDSSMSGKIYLDLQKDLIKTPADALTEAQSEKASQHAINLYQQTSNTKNKITETKSELKVYITKDNIAHYIYRVSFSDEAEIKRPVYFLDAENFHVYENYDEVISVAMNSVDAGGFGGNKNTGMLNLYYKLDRDDAKNICYLQNATIRVRNFNTQALVYFPCYASDPQHDNAYWNPTLDQVNSGYAPANDVFFNAHVTKKMYDEWYGVTLYIPNLLVHEKTQDPRYADNAGWRGIAQISFGDGYLMFYPLTSLDVVAHELSHGFILTHSKLVPNLGESGALHEAFADMGAQAVELYFYGKPTWQIAEDVMQAKGQALRYMNQPSLDCIRGAPCSIDTYDKYTGQDVHKSCGVYNRFFYLLATSPGWDAKKAFKLMIQANYYWTSYVGFNCAARGVINAATQLGEDYDLATIKKAFDSVGVKYGLC